MNATTDFTLHYPQEWPVYSVETIQQCHSLLEHGRSFDYGYGTEIAALEEGFAEYIGRKFALSFNSGTSALYAAYYAAGIGEGNEVIVPSYTFLSTASPLFLLKAIPVLADSAEDNGNVGVETIASLITSRTRAIVVTHLWGHPVDVAAIQKLARDNNLLFIEDCSHAHGATWRGERVGHFGDLAIFSVGSHKPVSGGCGGILLTDNPEFHAKACLLGHFKQRSRASVHDPRFSKFHDVGFGGNLRISTLGAVLAKSHLDGLEALIAARNTIFRRYNAIFSKLPGLTPLPISAECTMGGWYVYNVSIDFKDYSRESFLEWMNQAGLKLREPATKPLHLLSIFSGSYPPHWGKWYTEDQCSRSFSYSREHCIRSTDLFDRWVSLPSNFFYDPDSEFAAAYAELFKQRYLEFFQR